MTPDTIAQSIMAAAMLWVALNPRKVAEFVDDCSDGNVAKLERIDEMATEARSLLAVMCDRRVA